MANPTSSHQFLPTSLTYGLKSSKLTRGVCEFFAILRKSMSGMKEMTRIALLIAVLFCGVGLSGSAQEFCCDPDSDDILGNGLQCSQEDGGFFQTDDTVCDSDCEDYDGAAACIPLDGGLSLLALAGGGLATAAMRRRREEEEAAEQGAA